VDLTFNVLTYGDARLRATSVPVEQVDDTIRALVRNMLETMYANHGLGLAAQQVGHNESICVIDIPKEAQEAGGESLDVAMPLVLINPEITEQTGHVTDKEGCLSFPEIFVSVKRAEEIVVAYRDLEDRPQELRARGLLARAVQHELDHLAGVLLVDRMGMVQKAAHAGKLKRLKEQAG
jgi:peptide deformylase